MSVTRARARLRVGFIGLGVMGRPMAANLLRAGFPLTVTDLSAEAVAAAAALGATPVGCGREVAAASDVVIVMVPTADDLAACLEGPDGVDAGLARGSVVIAMGTHPPAAVRTLAADARRRGHTLIDAPVSGGESGARDASLAIMVGGPRAVVRRVWPVLEAVGTPVHVGGIGAGQVAKACSQLVVAATIEAVAEAITLARAAGVDPARVRAAMRGGYGESRILELHAGWMVDGDFGAHGRTALFLKDIRITRDLAAEVGVELPGFDPVLGQFEKLLAAGGGALDHSAVITVLEPAPGGARGVGASPRDAS